MLHKGATFIIFSCLCLLQCRILKLKRFLISLLLNECPQQHPHMNYYLFKILPINGNNFFFFMLLAFLMAFIVSYPFYMLFKINQHHLWTHNRYIFSLHVIPCSGVDHLIKLQTRTWTAVFYFLHPLSPSSSGSGVVHSRSSWYILF